MEILQLENVVKSYQNHVAVNNVSFSVPKGKIFGLLGPNGAGKSSLIRIITTITRADSGTILFQGEPLSSKTPEKIGYMPEERGLYKKMKVGEQLVYLARLKGLSAKDAKSAIKSWMQKFEIEDWWGKKVDELSKGMQQKIQFISTILHRPPLLILDEPFSGLDPINTNLIKDEIDNLHNEGTTILFSTHRMEQVEQVCEEIVLINKGQIILQGNVPEVKQRFKDNLYQLKFEGELPNDLTNTFDVVEKTDHSITIHLENEVEDSNDLLRHFIQKNVHVTSFQEILPSLNEIFIKQVGGESDE